MSDSKRQAVSRPASEHSTNSTGFASWSERCIPVNAYPLGALDVDLHETGQRKVTGLGKFVNGHRPNLELDCCRIVPMPRHAGGGKVVVATAASLCSVFLVARLFGTWVAAYFALTNFTWLQVSFLGGSEPLAVALVFGAFWLFARERWFLASLLASVAVTVRPLMIFALVGMGLTLLDQKRYRPFAVVFVTSRSSALCTFCRSRFTSEILFSQSTVTPPGTTERRS